MESQILFSISVDACHLPGIVKTIRVEKSRPSAPSVKRHVNTTEIS